MRRSARRPRVLPCLRRRGWGRAVNVARFVAGWLVVVLVSTAGIIGLVATIGILVELVAGGIA